jgi:hypothetical protein
MLIVCASMPKSGSAYIYNLLNDLLIAHGLNDARRIKSEYKLTHLMTRHNCNIWELTDAKIARLLRISESAGTFAVKTHCQPTPTVVQGLANHTIKVVYISRDPRAVCLSAMEHGKKLNEIGDTHHTMAKNVDFATALQSVSDWISIWNKWNSCRGVFFTTYEQLLNDRHKVMASIAVYLGLAVDSRKIDSIIEHYDERNLTKERKIYLHYNQPSADRFRIVFTQDQLSILNNCLYSDIISMGYSAAREDGI